MRKIKFSHKYEKFPESFNITTLLAVFTVNRKDLSKAFVKYNTFYADVFTGGSKTYGDSSVPKGKLLVLIFASGLEKVRLWTTVIRWTEHKEKYYRNAIECEFEVIVKNG